MRGAQDVGSYPENGPWPAALPCPLSAKNEQMHRTKKHRYSITSSAKVISVGGTVRPSTFALLMRSAHWPEKPPCRRTTLNYPPKPLNDKADVSAMAAMTRSMA